MKLITLFGVLLIVLGLGALAFQQITYTKRETVVDVGPIHATADERKTIPLPPIVGIVAIASGVVLVVAGKTPDVGHTHHGIRRGAKAAPGGFDSQTHRPCTDAATSRRH